MAHIPASLRATPVLGNYHLNSNSSRGRKLSKSSFTQFILAWGLGTLPEGM